MSFNRQKILTLKTRLSEKPFSVQMSFLREKKKIFSYFDYRKKKHISGFAVSLALKRGLEALGNGLLAQATVAAP